MKPILIICLLLSLTSLAFTQTLQDTLIGDFYQGIVKTGGKKFKDCIHDKNFGNCATIALIKSSLSLFGNVHNIYKSVSVENDNSLRLVFGDNDTVVVSQEDLRVVDSLAGFRKRREGISLYYDTAIIMYASIAKRVLKNPGKYTRYPNCITSFKKAIFLVNSGFNTPTVCRLLALDAVRVKVNRLSEYPSAIIWSSKHAAYCTSGKQDHWGQVYKIKSDGKMNNAGSNKRSISGALVLKKL